MPHRGNRCRTTLAVLAVVAAGGLLRSGAAFLLDRLPATAAPGAAAKGVELRGAYGVLSRAVPARRLAADMKTGGASVAAFAGLAAIGALQAALASARRPHSSREQAPLVVMEAATRVDWYRRVKRLNAELAVFDVTIKKPLGVGIQKFPQRAGVGIDKIVEGGNTAKLNDEVCISETNDGMWVLEGDRIMAVDGEDCFTEDVKEISTRIANNGKDEVDFTLMRNIRKGPVRVVYLPDGKAATVKRGSRLSQAAEYAYGKPLKYGCIDGWCGTCWHRERSTNGVFKPCCDTITGDWDNTMPLAITPKPERAGDSANFAPRGAE